MTVSMLPPLRRPPHDPLSVRLGGRLGWPVTGDDGPDDAAETLELPRLTSSLRLLTEPSGSLGGLRPSANVAVTDAGEVWLLDPQRGLLRLDPCACTFEEVPCLPEGAAGGIAFAAGHLFVCDPANQRVEVLLTPQLVLSGVWQAPIPWSPMGVAVDGRFRVHVVDPMNGMVHHFGWSGRYLGNTPGVGASTFIAAADDGSLVVAGPVMAYRINEGAVTEIEPTVAGVAGLDLASPQQPQIEVSADGRMRLGVLCVPPTDGWFDPHGVAVSAPVVATEIYDRVATVLLGPLDSLIDQCVWHRVVLYGELPSGCSIGMDSFTAQVPLSAAEAGALPEQAWETRLSATEFAGGSWDGLVRGPAGRYLWLRLRLAGTGAVTPRLDEALVEFPRVSLRRHLPEVYGAEPTSADFTDRLLAIFDRSLRDTESEIDDLPALLDPRATSHLDWLASWIGLRPDHRLPESLQRDIVANAGHILDLRGTVAGLRKLLLVALGLDQVSCGSACGCGSCPEPRQTCPPRPVVRPRFVPPPLVLEHFRLRRWFEAGASTLGDRTVLWGQSIVQRSQLGTNAQVGATALKGTQDPLRDPFHVYAHKFTVFVPASAGGTPERRRALERLVAWGSPAHTVGTVQYVDPRLRIGVQSSIGLDTVVARLPAGVTLGETPLGRESVLDSDERLPLGQSVQHSLGSATVLG
jgi:phage tail-like protein